MSEKSIEQNSRSTLRSTKTRLCHQNNQRAGRRRSHVKESSFPLGKPGHLQRLNLVHRSFATSTGFINVDMAHGYWKVPLSPERKEMMPIQTKIGVYSSNRSPQGGNYSGNHFQAVLEEKFDGSVEKILQWIHDFLFYARIRKNL